VKKVNHLIEILPKFPKLRTIHDKETFSKKIWLSKLPFFYSVSNTRIIILSFFDTHQSSYKKKF
jgi:hypothetical protein